ncbi:MAG: maltose ABC transporter substrate-binding protein [Treponema sp.]|nr:maltose ABC transporter substrate-binding protein [Treponema sp.]
MKQVYKLSSKIALLAFFMMILNSCSGKNSIVPEWKNKNIKLTVWESTEGPDAFIRKAGEAYTKLHPNIEILYVNVNIANAPTSAIENAPNGLGPDLFAAPNDTIPTCVNANIILPTENPAEIKSKVLGACSKALTYNGTMYGYPVSAETYALFYNKNLISEQQVPKNWNDLINWIKVFNQENPGKQGFVMPVTGAYYTIMFATKNGNRLFGASGENGNSPNLNTRDAKEGMKVLQELGNAMNHLDTQYLGDSTSTGMFQAGNAAMCITGLWSVNSFEEAGIKFGVAPIPALPGESTPAVSFSGTRGMFVCAHTQHPNEANDFAKFLLTPEMQKLRFNLTQAMPAIDIKVDSPYMEGFIKQLEYAVPMPLVPQMSKFWDALGNASIEIWNGKDINHAMDVCNSEILQP